MVAFIWTMVLHMTRIPHRVELRWTPNYLLCRGPYRFTRNPMFVAVLLIWMGWTVFYGSVAVLLGCLLAWAVINFVAIPREERNLEARFGETYREYKRSVPRWLGSCRHID